MSVLAAFRIMAPLEDVHYTGARDGLSSSGKLSSITHRCLAQQMPHLFSVGRPMPLLSMVLVCSRAFRIVCTRCHIREEHCVLDPLIGSCWRTVLWLAQNHLSGHKHVQPQCRCMTSTRARRLQRLCEYLTSWHCLPTHAMAAATKCHTGVC